jgi:hypothetical protein
MATTPCARGSNGRSTNGAGAVLTRIDIVFIAAAQWRGMDALISEGPA